MVKNRLNKAKVTLKQEKQMFVHKPYGYCSKHNHGSCEHMYIEDPLTNQELQFLKKSIFSNNR